MSNDIYALEFSFPNLRVRSNCFEAELFAELGVFFKGIGFSLNLAINGNPVEIQLKANDFAPHLPHTLNPITLEEGTAHVLDRNLCIKIDAATALITPYSDESISVYLPETPSVQTVCSVVAHTVSAALRRRHKFELHAAGLCNAPQGIKALLIGDSGSGKTTLTMQLAKHGWNYLSDDTIILQVEADKVLASPLRRVFALTEQTRNACGVKPTYKNAGDKYVITPDELFPGGQIERMEPNHLVFPVIKPQATSELKPLTQSNAMMRLLHKSPWAVYDPVTGEAHLKVLSRLAQTTQAWELHAGRDLLEQPERASELLGSLGS